MAELDINVGTEAPEEPEVKSTEPESTGNDELARLKADMAKLKAANDKLAKENSEKTKQLRAKQSEEEVAAEEAKALQESMQEELKQLRKEKAVAGITAKVLPLIGDGEAAGQVAEYLYGAEDVDAAVAVFQKAWAAKEKALRLEYGKIPLPGAGGSDGPTITMEQLDKMTDMERLKFKTEHPEEYERVMGR